jgi:hypothetical protein
MARGAGHDRGTLVAGQCLSVATSLILVRELDDRVGLGGPIERDLTDSRRGKRA